MCVIMMINLRTCNCNSFSTVGHGRSEGDRVDVNSIDTYAVDVMTHVEQVKAEYPDTPCILLGHSMVCTHT